MNLEHLQQNFSKIFTIPIYWIWLIRIFFSTRPFIQIYRYLLNGPFCSWMNSPFFLDFVFSSFFSVSISYLFKTVVLHIWILQFEKKVYHRNNQPYKSPKIQIDEGFQHYYVKTANMSPRFSFGSQIGPQVVNSKGR